MEGHGDVIQDLQFNVNFLLHVILRAKSNRPAHST